MRYLAIDLGDKRTGLAVGDDETGLASPLRTVEIPLAQQGRLIDALSRAIDEEGAGAAVLGLPLNMDGSEGSRAELVRAFGEALRGAAGVPLHYHDERLTTADADWSMARSGLTHKQKKARRDALAAASVLRDFLSARGGDTPAAPSDGAP